MVFCLAVLCHADIERVQTQMALSTTGQALGGYKPLGDQSPQLVADLPQLLAQKDTPFPNLSSLWEQ